MDSLFPKPWTAEILPIVWQMIFIDWLYREVPAEMQMSILSKIYGWRNREVFEWLQADKERRDHQLCIDVYGMH